MSREERREAQLLRVLQLLPGPTHGGMSAPDLVRLNTSGTVKTLVALTRLEEDGCVQAVRVPNPKLGPDAVRTLYRLTTRGVWKREGKL